MAYWCRAPHLFFPPVTCSLRISPPSVRFVARAEFWIHRHHFRVLLDAQQEGTSVLPPSSSFQFSEVCRYNTVLRGSSQNFVLWDRRGIIALLSLLRHNVIANVSRFFFISLFLCLYITRRLVNFLLATCPRFRHDPPQYSLRNYSYFLSCHQANADIQSPLIEVLCDNKRIFWT